MWLAIACVLLVCVAGKCPDVPVVQQFDPAKYLGQWYEIGANPLVKDTFERDCACTNALYGLYGPGNVSVTNKCSKGGSAGPISMIKVRRRVRAVPASLFCRVTPRWEPEVPFFFPSVFSPTANQDF